MKDFQRKCINQKHRAIIEEKDPEKYGNKKY